MNLKFPDNLCTFACIPIYVPFAKDGSRHFKANIFSTEPQYENIIQDNCFQDEIQLEILSLPPREEVEGRKDGCCYLYMCHILLEKICLQSS